MASDGSATEAAHDTTSSAVHSESLDGCWRGGARGLVGREAGGAPGDSGGVLRPASEVPPVPPIGAACGAGLPTKELFGETSLL